jgi:hypothetical protein
MQVKEYNKITVGFVTQKFVLSPDGVFRAESQEFIAGDDITRENEYGEIVDVDVDKEVYCPFNMKAPRIGRKVKSGK